MPKLISRETFIDENGEETVIEVVEADECAFCGEVECDCEDWEPPMIENSVDDVFTYFENTFGRPPDDVTLLGLARDSTCGLECCNMIDRAQSLISICDPVAHADILAGVERAISVKWHR
jgi:hypothetical protein